MNPASNAHLVHSTLNHASEQSIATIQSSWGCQKGIRTPIHTKTTCQLYSDDKGDPQTTTIRKPAKHYMPILSFLGAPFLVNSPCVVIRMANDGTCVNDQPVTAHLGAQQDTTGQPCTTGHHRPALPTEAPGIAVQARPQQLNVPTTIPLLASQVPGPGSDKPIATPQSELPLQTHCQGVREHRAEAAREESHQLACPCTVKDLPHPLPAFQFFTLSGLPTSNKGQTTCFSHMTSAELQQSA